MAKEEERLHISLTYILNILNHYVQQAASAQATGSNTSCLDEVMSLSDAFARTKLGI